MIAATQATRSLGWATRRAEAHKHLGLGACCTHISAMVTLGHLDARVMLEDARRRVSEYANLIPARGSKEI